MRIIFLLPFLFIFFNSKSQITYGDAGGLDFGASAKIGVELSKRPSVRISAGLGVGKLLMNERFYPSLNADIQLYLLNGFGSAQSYSASPSLFADVTLAPTATFGVMGDEFTNTFSPLLYFADFHSTALTNPFRYSGSIGTNFVYLSKREKSSKLQRVAFFGAKLGQNFQAYYYNDGGPTTFWGTLADRHDRYYTGGGGAVVTLDQDYAITNLTVNYHKFTGYKKGAFETADQMQIDFTNYNDSTAVFYNNAKIYLSASNFEHGLQLRTGLFNNNEVDIQDWIHYINDFTFHFNPYKSHFFVEGEYGLGKIYNQ